MRKNIAIFCPSANFGGMELDSLKLAKKLNPYCNIVLVTKKGGFIEQNFDKYFSKDDSVVLESLAFKSLSFINTIIQTKKIFKKYNIKNIIYFGTSKLRIVYFSLLGTNINLIVRHGTTRRKKKGFFNKLVYNRINYHIAICKHLLQNIKQIFPFGRNTKTILIYTPIEFKNLNKQNNKKLIILHTGRIAKGKGQVDAIKACEVLVHNNIDFELILVGGYEEGYEEEFIEFYNRVSYKNKIKLLGFTNEVDKYLIKADIFLFPSYGEGLSNSFLEALSASIKCITYNNTSFPELKEMGLDFILVENRDIYELKEKLLKVAKNEIVFDFNKNKKIIETKFSQENEIKKYLDILR
ncbi:4-alpha-N-acetylgalactosaminyltransferase [Aliarcobacter thereius]|uniref:glycosyltransferase n=1 Tax=Aliarcobacter thereius TaxID=544718 RepID=UPI0008276B48|nr:glycosyltransferase [Aliarcobacter thereius]OCL87901.1 4-alpha-N-acetylgalactosaminyltransferase [Aliarcobacter thereius]TLT08336.1 glycosyltransferase [Aliarcobacter thereius]